MTAKKLMIADDDPALRELVAATLESQAYQILVAADGSEALDIARRERPQLAILDYHMPGLDGLEVCHRIRDDADLAGTVVVMLTASDQHRDEAFAAGASAYLTKPFSPLQLLRVVEEALQPEQDRQQRSVSWAPPKPETSSTLAAFMFADIRDFTGFTVRNGDAAAHQLLRQFQRLVSEQLGLHGGRKVNEAGDNVLLVFPTARQALQTALGLIGAVGEYNQGAGERRLEVGVGLDVGEPVEAEGDYIGRALNRAARITDLAGGGRVLATETVKHLVADIPGVSYLDLGARTLRGFAEEERLYEVLRPGARPDEEAARSRLEPAPTRVLDRRLLMAAAATTLVIVAAVMMLVAGSLPSSGVASLEQLAPTAAPR